MNDKFTAPEIAGMLANDLFHFSRYLIVSNVSWGMLPWEADLLVMSKAGYLSEIEIKVSLSDLRRDAKKKKWANYAQSHNMLKARWFAMPKAVWEGPGAADAVPAEAGVIVCAKPKGLWDICAHVEVPAVENKTAKPLSNEEKFQLARLGTMRHWSRLARQARKSKAGGA